MKIEVAYLDRDGTINIDRHYLADPAGFEFCPGAVEGLAKLRDLGIALVVITNQSGIARGYFPPSALEAIHLGMRMLLAEEGISLAGIYVCPHGPEDGCACRKPLPGLIDQAEADLGQRPAVVIGDSLRDIEAGKARGHQTIRIADPDRIDSWQGSPDFVARDLPEAANWIASRQQGG